MEKVYNLYFKKRNINHFYTKHVTSLNSWYDAWLKTNPYLLDSVFIYIIINIMNFVEKKIMNGYLRKLITQKQKCIFVIIIC